MLSAAARRPSATLMGQPRCLRPASLPVGHALRPGPTSWVRAKVKAKAKAKVKGMVLAEARLRSAASAHPGRSAWPHRPLRSPRAAGPARHRRILLTSRP